MVKNKLIMKKPKRPMNAMESYRRKEKDKEKRKNKTHRRDHTEDRIRDKEEKHDVLHVPNNFYDNNKDDFEGQEDLLELDPDAIQKILQEKQRMRELKYGGSSVKANIEDIMQSFSKKPNTSLNKQMTTGNQTTTQQAPSSLSSFVSENIIRSNNLQERDQSKPIFVPSSVQQKSNQLAGSQKTMVGDKRLQKRDNTAGGIDPFMMTTIQGNYDPTQKKKDEQEQVHLNPLMGSFRSSTPGVYQQIEKPVIEQKPISSGPSVIVKGAALNAVPLRSQLDKEKANLIPVNLLKKKAPKPETENQNKVNQPALNIGIMNVTNVPAPKTNFGFSQNIQQNTTQNDQLSAFLSEISKLDE